MLRPYQRISFKFFMQQQKFNAMEADFLPQCHNDEMVVREVDSALV